MQQGKDEICYIMLKNASIVGLMKLLILFVWEEGRISERWKEAIIILIRKPGKDAGKSENYRPIVLNPAGTRHQFNVRKTLDLTSISIIR